MNKFKYYYLHFFIVVLSILFLYKLEFFRWLDYSYFDESIKDLVGKNYYREDWLIIPNIEANNLFDHTRTGEIYIGHALGSSGEQEENTIS